MKAARLHKIGDFRVDDMPVPKPVGKEILMKVGACGVCGSDIPRIFELGTSKQKYPLTLGHEFAGEIVEVGEEADPGLVGKVGAVFPCIPCMKCSNCLSANYAMCLDYDYLGSRSDGGFAEYCLIPSDWHFVESPGGRTSMEALSMVEPCTVAQHALRKGKVDAGSSLLIFGAGPIGMMAGRWGKIFGAETVMLVDVLDEKVAFARERGFHVVNGRTEDVLAAFQELSGGRLPDVAIEGTGSGAALGQCCDCVRTFGTVVLMGNPHADTTIKLAQHSQILRKEITLQGIWNSHYADTPLNEWKYTVKKLNDGSMVVEDLISHRVSLDKLPRLCEDIYKQRVNICKALYSADA